MKIGFSKDIHKLEKDSKKPLILGGFLIKNNNWTIKAHSDGDVILHSITSAILGALGLRTLGEYFPDTDINNQNRSSKDFLLFAKKMLIDSGYYIESLDICIVCEQIILKNYLNEIKTSIETLLGIKNIGIKATRFEDQNNNYIESYASLLLNK